MGFGFKQSNVEQCVFYKDNSIIAVYADDLVIAGDSNETIQCIQSMLDKSYKLKHLGPISWILGIQIVRSELGFDLTQDFFITKIMKKTFGYENAKAKSCPMVCGQDATEHGEDTRKFEYRQAIGSLLYVARGTRPDISFAVSMLSRYLDKYTSTHVNMEKRIFQYLVGTKEKSLRIWSDNELCLNGFADADWAGNRSDRKSTTGVLLKLGRSSIL